jgi:hypothetical protein
MSHATDPLSAESELEASRVRLSNAERARNPAFCHTCGKSAALWCNGCFTAVYCGTACQRANWSTHKAPCVATRPYAAANKRAATACGEAGAIPSFVSEVTSDGMLAIIAMHEAVAAVEASFGVLSPTEGVPLLLLEGPGGEAPPAGLTSAQRVERYVRGLACVDDLKNMQANLMFNKIMRAAQRSLDVREYSRFCDVLKERRIGSFNRV